MVVRLLSLVGVLQKMWMGPSGRSRWLRMAVRMLPAVVGPAWRCEMLRPGGWRGAVRAGLAARLALAGSRGAGLGKIAHRRRWVIFPSQR